MNGSILVGLPQCRTLPVRRLLSDSWLLAIPSLGILWGLLYKTSAMWLATRGHLTSTTYPKSDNAYNDESVDVKKSERFADILKRREEVISQMAVLQEQERQLQQEMLDLAGFHEGQTVDLRPGTLGILNNVRAEAHPAVRGNALFLRIAGECSPLTASGQPSKRETHARFRHVLWHVETSMSKEEVVRTGVSVETAARLKT